MANHMKNKKRFAKNNSICIYNILNFGKAYK